MEPKIQEKVWDPKIESEIRKKWEDSKLYEFHSDTDGYTIDTPPPYPSGRPWHIGAAAHYSQIDMISRTARMNGKNVYFPLGIDRNGLPVELYTEKNMVSECERLREESFWISARMHLMILRLR
uniref:valine--tRNA ligase n=1 Tax=uncultured marine thaumarchaeote AD1000_05_B01 TaxID=1455883 RepID=A0A075FMG1_9ARCH|nr:valyl-tRNA synthetase (VARS, valS) [uncultured marine thaumarchaeote AD1000_05_B01]